MGKSKKIKLDMTKTIKELEEKTKKNPYWGTGITGTTQYVNDQHL